MTNLITCSLGYRTDTLTTADAVSNPFTGLSNEYTKLPVTLKYWFLDLSSSLYLFHLSDSIWMRPSAHDREYLTTCLFGNGLSSWMHDVAVIITMKRTASFCLVFIVKMRF